MAQWNNGLYITMFFKVHHWPWDNSILSPSASEAILIICIKLYDTKSTTKRRKACNVFSCQLIKLAWDRFPKTVCSWLSADANVSLMTWLTAVTIAVNGWSNICTIAHNGQTWRGCQWRTSQSPSRSKHSPKRSSEQIIQQIQTQSLWYTHGVGGGGGVRYKRIHWHVCYRSYLYGYQLS